MNLYIQVQKGDVWKMSNNGSQTTMWKCDDNGHSTCGKGHPGRCNARDVCYCSAVELWVRVGLGFGQGDIVLMGCSLLVDHIFNTLVVHDSSIC